LGFVFQGNIHHIPDITKQDGFLDVVALGNLLELGELLDKRFHLGQLSKQDAEEHRIARFSYHSFQKWFLKQYVLACDESIISPSAVFDRALCQFSASLILYKRKSASVNQTDKPPPKMFQAIVEDFFSEVHPGLVNTLKQLVRSEEGSLYWTGPDFSIHDREECDKDAELKCFGDWKLCDDYEEKSDSSSEEEEPVPPSRGRKRRIVLSDGERRNVSYLISN
jgi:hypothetical protein